MSLDAYASIADRSIQGAAPRAGRWPQLRASVQAQSPGPRGHGPPAAAAYWVVDLA